LYDTYHRRVYAYVVSRAGRQLADEVVSDTFVIAWRRLAELPEPALPWLFGVARNLLREQSRRQGREESLAQEMRTWTAFTEVTSDDPADLVSERADMLSALGRLSDDDRELLTLIAWHGLTAHDAAEVVGCSSATFFVRLHRARKRLEQALTPDGEPLPSTTSSLVAASERGLAR
jgi:RNA polymerase sigma-70 factor (ECF subfamily)